MSKTGSSSTEEKRPIAMTSNNQELKVEDSVAVTETKKKKKMLILKTNDNEYFEVEESVAIQAMTLKNLIDVDECASTVIPLPNVSSETLVKVIEYLKGHADSKASENDLSNFDELFLQDSNSPDELIDLMSAANYLDISGLLDITSQKIADSISVLSVEEVRQYFDIENDFTPEEEEKIRKENAWAFE